MTMALRRLSRVSLLLSAGLVMPANCGDGNGPEATAKGAAAAVATNGASTCALARTGQIRCWGRNAAGELGNGASNQVVDADTAIPSSAADVQVGGAAVAIDIGSIHVCAVLQSGSLRCWGSNRSGQLGYPGLPQGVDSKPVVPAQAGDVPIGEPIEQVSLGLDHSCALTRRAGARCWGSLRGFGPTGSVGSQTMPIDPDVVPADRTAQQIVAGTDVTCVLLSDGRVRCWGRPEEPALLGPSLNARPGESVRDVTIGGTVRHLALGARHACALLQGGGVRCWGQNATGALGYGHTRTVGDDEDPASAGDVALGGNAIDVVAAWDHTCALLESGAVRCWGAGSHGRLGYGDTHNIGDDESPASAGDVPLGEKAVQISAGGEATCAVLASGLIRCWGRNTGNLGTGNFQSVGDDELPSSIPALTVF